MSYIGLKEGMESFSSKGKALFFSLSFITLAMIVVLPILISSNSLFVLNVSKNYRPFELSDEDVISPTDFTYIDTVATEEKKLNARSSVLPYFSYSLSDSMDMRNAVEGLIKYSGTGEADDEIPVSSSLMDSFMENDAKTRALLITLIEEGINRLTYEGVFSYDELSSIGEGMIQVEDLGIGYKHEGKEFDSSLAITDESIYSFLIDLYTMTYPGLTSRQIGIIIDIVSEIVKPNLHYDFVMTKHMQDKAESLVEPVLIEIKAGDYILRKDRIVSEQDLRTINAINSSTIANVPPLSILSDVLYAMTVLLILFGLVFYFCPFSYRIPLYSYVILIGIDLSLLAAYFISVRLSNIYAMRYIDPFLPFYFAPLLISSLTGKRRIGFAVVLVLACSSVLYPFSKSFTFFFVLLTAMITLFYSKLGNNRIDMIIQALLSAFSSAVISMLVSFIYGQPIMQILLSMLVTFISVLASYIMLSIILPIVERIFNVPTSYRLNELSNTDTSTLNRLNQVANGTYNHVRNVADLAYDAAKAIGANAELARVGALYHDIGKAEHPEYFIENQNGKNAHDQINTTLSVAIIKSHVKLGVEKAKEIGLPQEVTDIIAEHHGNDLIKYFYNEAQKEAKANNSIVAEEDFRYNGRIPSSPESAIVMLADCSEAATRTIKNPNHQKYDKFINNIIIDKINYNQLNNSRLTLNDLDKIKDSFIHNLIGRDHQRIEYDKE